jgi:hypothetical protein
MGRLWAMDQAISKCKEVGGVKCVALGKSILRFGRLRSCFVITFSIRHWILRHEKTAASGLMRTISYVSL